MFFVIFVFVNDIQLFSFNETNSSSFWYWQIRKLENGAMEMNIQSVTEHVIVCSVINTPTLSKCNWAWLTR